MTIYQKPDKVIIPTEVLSMESIEDFQQLLSLRGRADNTIRAYTADLRMFWKWIGGLKASNREDEIPNLEVAAMTWFQSEKGLISPSTQRRRWATLTAFAKTHGDDSFLEMYRPPRNSEPNPHPLSGGLGDVQKLFNYCQTIDEMCLVLFGGRLGLRISETLSIKAGQLSAGQEVLRVTGKGTRQRMLPVPEDLRTTLTAFAMSRGPEELMVSLPNSTARRRITDIGRRCDIQVASHDLRATFATWVYNKTLDVVTVQRLLGHSSPETTQRYINSTGASLAAAVTL